MFESDPYSIHVSTKQLGQMLAGNGIRLTKKDHGHAGSVYHKRHVAVHLTKSQRKAAVAGEGMDFQMSRAQRLHHLTHGTGVWDDVKGWVKEYASKVKNDVVTPGVKKGLKSALDILEKDPNLIVRLATKAGRHFTGLGVAKGGATAAGGSALGPQDDDDGAKDGGSSVFPGGRGIKGGAIKGIK